MNNYFQKILNEYTNSKTKEQVDALRKKEGISFRTSAGHPTQRPNTTSTYLKFYKLLTPEEQQGKGLDYSAGLGKGSALLRQEFNANIESYEPFPHENSEDITYSGLNSLPDKLYDYIFCSAVLNVVEQDIRNFIVLDIYAHLKPGGQAIIGVRSKADVLSARTAYVIDAENGEIIDRVRGSYQKGFTGPELREYISDILPEAAVTRVEVSGFSQIVVRVARSEWDAYEDLTEAKSIKFVPYSHFGTLVAAVNMSFNERKEYGEQRRILLCEVHFKKLFRLTYAEAHDNAKIYYAIRNEDKYPELKAEWNKSNVVAAEHALENLGYDGIVYYNHYDDESDSYIIFHPEQVKIIKEYKGTRAINNLRVQVGWDRG
jgi:hypothetical protein